MKLKIRTPEDRKISPITGWTRDHWHEVFVDLMKGCMMHTTPGKSMIRFPGGTGSFYDPRTDGMEGFTRMLWMAGPFLNGSKTGRLDIDGKSVDVAAYCREGILIGTNPQSGDNYWGDIRTRHQTIVESAAAAFFLFISRKHVWDKMEKGEQDQVANWLKGVIEKEPYPGNWALFKVLVNAALKALGREYSRFEINAMLEFMLRYYSGNGWYSDGPGMCYEYYNAWTIHPYLYLWMMMDGESRPDLVPAIRSRTREFLDNYKYFFAGSGAHVPFGRSLIYRMGAVAIFPIAELFGVSPLSPGEARRICSGNLKYFVEHGAIEDHRMTMGWHGEFLPLPEVYSSTQSPYWGAKAWWTFLLPPESPFWTAREEPSEIEKQSYIVPIPGAGIMVQGDQKTGQVMVYLSKSREWAKKKYSNLSFSSHFGFDIKPHKVKDSKDEWFNFDGGVCASEDGKHFIHRMYPVHILTGDHFSESYHMPFFVKPGGDRDPANRIYTALVLKDDYHLRIHMVAANRNFQVFDGAVALGYDSGQPAIQSGKGWECARHGKKVSFIQNLHGYNGQVKAAGFGGEAKGNNMMHDFSVVPALKFKGASVDGRVFASLVVANLKGSTPKQLCSLVTKFEVDDNLVHIVFHDGEEVYTQIGEWRDIFVTLGGHKLTGRVVFARHDAAGRMHVLNHDGSLIEY